MKNAIREKILHKRVNQLTFLKKRRDREIISTLIAMDEFKHAHNILFYLPIFGEVEITPLFIEFGKKKNFYLPRVVNNTKTMRIHKIESLEDLEKGSFGIIEPKNHLNSIEPEKLDLILLPGIAFSLNGHRIGYGHGFFDKFLKKTKCPKLGIAYEFQIVKNIDAEPHDVPVDKIITNQRIIEIPTE